MKMIRKEILEAADGKSIILFESQDKLQNLGQIYAQMNEVREVQSQRRVFSSIKHLRWSICEKMLAFIFTKKLLHRCLAEF